MYNLSICRRNTLSLSAVLASLSAACLLVPFEANALDLTVHPRINTGMMYYQFEQDDQFDVVVFDGRQLSAGLTDITYSDVMPFIGGGATVFLDRFYVDGYVQKAFSGNDVDIQDMKTFATGPNDIIGELRRTSTERDWDREEYSLSLGYSITGILDDLGYPATDRFVVFAGYRRSDTEFDQAGTALDLDTGQPAFPNAPPFRNTLEYEQDGPFVGAAYGYRIGEVGVLAFNFGLGLIEGEISSPTGIFLGPTGELVTIKGDTIGTTLGVSWTAPLPVFDRLNYTVAIDGYRYDFDADTEFAADFSEMVIRGTAGVSYAFDLL
jgi:hypothetical protein